MKKKDRFAKLLESVADKTELSPKKILSNDISTDTVDARHLLIYSLSQCGFYPTDIADFIGCTRRTVYYAIEHFDVRLLQSKMLRIYWEIIKKQEGID